MIDSRFQIELQNTLKQLKRNINDIESAKDQIQTAKETAIKVVDGMDQLQGEQIKHLETLKEEANQFLSKATNLWQDQIDKGMSELQLLFNSISGLRDNYISDSTQLHKNVQDQQANHISELGQQNESQFNHLKGLTETLVGTASGKMTDQIQIMQSRLEEFLETMNGGQQRTMQENSHLLEKGMDLLDDQKTWLSSSMQDHQQSLASFSEKVENWRENQKTDTETLTENLLSKLDDKSVQLDEQFSNKLSAYLSSSEEKYATLTNSLNTHIGKVSELNQLYNQQIKGHLGRYEKLVSVVEKLSNDLGKIDFEAKLEHLENHINQLSNSQREGMMTIQKNLSNNWTQYEAKQEEQTNAQNEQIKTLKFWMLIFIAINAITLIGLVYFFFNQVG